MRSTPYQEVLNAFGNDASTFSVEPVTDGLINTSYRATCGTTGNVFLLQKINHEVFHEPVLIQENYESIWNYLAEKGGEFYIPEPKPFPDGSILFCDSDDNYWRMFEFVKNTTSVTSPLSAEQAGEAASIFGRFTASLDEFDFDGLNNTIPGFHDLAARFMQFETSLKTHNYERLQKAAPIIQELKTRERYVSMYEVFIESVEFHLRVMHLDAKISNVLFDIDTGKAVCPVDLDTTMPGYFFSDLGDMVRSMAGSAAENENNNNGITIRKDYYEAIINGYLQWMGNKLTKAEKKYMHHSGLLMTYMQALRFITDYLNDDEYYRISYPEQNFDRAKNQLLLLQSLEQFLKQEYDYTV